MPLGDKGGWETNPSRFCGLETDFSDDVPSLLSFNIDNGPFDFVLAPLMNPSYRPSLVDESNSDSHVLPFAGSDLDMPPLRWKTRVIGKISSWIDLDSEDETLRMDSKATLKQEIAWANHLFADPHGDTYLLLYYEETIKRFFQHSVQVIISGKPLLNLQTYSVNITEGMQTHPHKTYLDCVSKMFHSMKPLSEQELMWIRLRDCLYRPLQPLKDNVVANTYELCERDYVKYIKYRRAIAKALEDRVRNEKASGLTTVLMVVGAGRGPLITASLQAAEETGRKLKVYAVEKNPNAVIALHDLVKTSGWEGTVTVVSCDMRFWNAPERADIMVSDLLGSFGDNDLSPESLDGAQRFLKPDGISIPSAYTSYIQPITTSKLYDVVKTHNDLSCFATAYQVNMHSIARLAPSQPVFTFTHPNLSRKPNNQRYKKLRFDLPSDMGSALVHGFAGYFEAKLYDDVQISIEPATATPNMFGWFPMFFPLSKPVEAHSNSPLEAHIWRCRDSRKVWYEWSVSLPTVSPIHNTNGSSY